MHRGTGLKLLASVGGVLLICGSAQADKIKWAESFKEAKKQVKRTNGLMMIDFYTNW